MGRWLIHPDEDLKAGEDTTGVAWNQHVTYSALKTKGGKIGIYTIDERAGNEENCNTFALYDTFEEFRDATMDSGRYNLYPENVIAAVADALDVSLLWSWTYKGIVL